MSAHSHQLQPRVGDGDLAVDQRSYSTLLTRQLLTPFHHHHSASSARKKIFPTPCLIDETRSKMDSLFEGLHNHAAGSMAPPPPRAQLPPRAPPPRQPELEAQPEFDDEEEVAEQGLFGGDFDDEPEEEEEVQEEDARSAVSAMAPGPALDRLRVNVATQPHYSEALMGVGIKERPLANPSGITATWAPMAEGLEEPVALRVQNINVPAGCWSPDAQDVKDWRTPNNTETRQRFGAIASLLSLHFAGTAQGILSGDHAELSEARRDNREPDEIQKMKEHLCPVSAYVYRPAKATDGSYFDFDLMMPM